VVTEECKYIYWCYGDRNMKPAEELYDLRKDPLELNNLANDSDSETLLENMRRLYDAHHWELSEKCVEGEDYRRLIKLFDRHVSWRAKDYRGFRFAQEKCGRAKFFPYTEGRSEKGCIILENIYRQLTGEEPS